MKQKILWCVVAIVGVLTISVTNGFSSGSYGTAVNTACAPEVIYANNDCALCHSGSYSNPTPAKDAYLAGGSTLTDFFCPDPVISYSLPENTKKEPVSIADFDGNGTPDILLRNNQNGRWFMNLMDGDTVISSTVVSLSTNLAREFAGIGDFNGDGKADVLLRNNANGRWFMNLMDGDTILLSDRTLLSTNTQRELAGIADFDFDGKADVMLRNSLNGRWFVSLMDGTTVLSTYRVQ